MVSFQLTRRSPAVSGFTGLTPPEEKLLLEIKKIFLNPAAELFSAANGHRFFPKSRGIRRLTGIVTRNPGIVQSIT